MRTILAGVAVVVAAVGCSKPTVMDMGGGLAGASADIGPKSGSRLEGTASFDERPDGTVRLLLEVRNAPPGDHAVHLHETGDCSTADASSAGAHWNPAGVEHGQHAGDIGNLSVGADGTGKLEFSSPAWTIFGDAATDVRGKALVIHASPDDGSPPSGNAGARIACGVVRAPSDVPKTAIVVLGSTTAGTVTGEAVFTEIGGQVTMKLGISGATPGHHAVHIHEFGDCSSTDGSSAGPHWNPTTGTHGQWGGPSFHLGDIGDVEVGPDGTAYKTLTTDLWSIGGPTITDVVGHAVIVHALHDDHTPPAGNAGARQACGVIRYPDRKARRATATLEAKSGSTVKGRAVFTNAGGATTLRLSITDAPPGAHAVHLHAVGDCSSADGLSAGGHWNPTNQPHGEMHGAGFHLGDIGNLVVASAGTAAGTGSLTRTVPFWSVQGSSITDVVGKAVIVHALPDDGATQPTGNAGARIACGVVTLDP